MLVVIEIINDNSNQGYLLIIILFKQKNENICKIIQLKKKKII